MGEANGKTKFMHFVYVLKSQKDNNLYIGCTENLDKRLKYHNTGKVRSTKTRVPFVILYSEVYDNKYEAFRIEKYYKTAKGKRELSKKL